MRYTRIRSPTAVSAVIQGYSIPVAVSSDVVSSDAVSGDAVSSDAVSSDAVSSGVVSTSIVSSASSRIVAST